MDLKDGFWNIEFTDKSSEICTFPTPFGRWKFKRFPFGLESAPEISQKNNEERLWVFQMCKYILITVIYVKNEFDYDKTLQLVKNKTPLSVLILDYSRIGNY